MITAEQRQLRRRYIGASDAPSVILDSGYHRAIDVWRSKVQGIDKMAGDKVHLGNFFERGLVEWACWKSGIDPFLVHHDRMVVHANGVMSANFDGMLPPASGLLIEAKVRLDQDRYEESEQYGRAGSGDVPASVLIQCLHQLYVAGPDYHTVLVPVLRCWGGHGPGLYKVKRDDKAIAMLVEKELAWWQRYVVGGVRPPAPDDEGDDNGNDSETGGGDGEGAGETAECPVQQDESAF